MDDLLKPYAGVVVSHGNLLSVLYNYQAPNFKIHRWLKDGQLWALKRGLYIVSPDVSGIPVSLPLLANQLYGPSYVSLEFALSHYGLIPEKTTQITSVTTKRAKAFENSIGKFSYQKLPIAYYCLGINYVKVNDTVAYMFASPEKALCDYLVLTPNLNLYSLKGMQAFLIQDMRIDESILQTFNNSKIRQFATVGSKSKTLSLLADYIEEDFLIKQRFMVVHACEYFMIYRAFRKI